MKMILVKRMGFSVDGQDLRRLRLRERRFYRSQACVDTEMRKTQDVWLLGPPQCGKSSAIERICQRSAQLWPHWPMIHWRACDPLSRWVDQAALQAHLLSQGKALKTMTVEDKLDALLSWAQHQKVVLVLDDAHALSGRKLDLTVRLAQFARVVLVGALSEQALHPSLRVCLQRRAPQVISMRSEAPYDATVSLMWVMLLLVMAAGWWELAAALSSARALGYGPLAVRQR